MKKSIAKHQMQAVIWKDLQEKATVKLSPRNSGDTSFYFQDIVSQVCETYKDSTKEDISTGFWWVQSNVTSYAHMIHVVHQIIDFMFVDEAFLMSDVIENKWEAYTSNKISLNDDIVTSTAKKKRTKNNNDVKPPVPVSRFTLLNHILKEYKETGGGKEFRYNTPLLANYFTRKESIAFLPCDFLTFETSFECIGDTSVYSNITPSLFYKQKEGVIRSSSSTLTSIQIVPRSVVAKFIEHKLFGKKGKERNKPTATDSRILEDYNHLYLPFNTLTETTSKANLEDLTREIVHTESVKQLDILITRKVRALSHSYLDTESLYNNFKTDPTVYSIKHAGQYKIHTNIPLDEYYKKYVIELTDMKSIMLTKACIFSFKSDIGHGKMFLYPNGIYRILINFSINDKLLLSDIIRHIRTPVNYVIEQVNESVMKGYELSLLDEYILNTFNTIYLKYSLIVNIQDKCDVNSIAKKICKLIPGFSPVKTSKGRHLIFYNVHGKNGRELHSDDSIKIFIKNMLSEDATVAEIEDKIKQQFKPANIGRIRELIQEVRKLNITENANNDDLDINLKLKRKDIFMFWLYQNSDKNVMMHVISSPNDRIKEDTIHIVKLCCMSFKKGNVDDKDLRELKVDTVDDTFNGDDDDLEDDTVDEDGDIMLDDDDIYNFSGGEGYNGPRGAKDIAEFDKLRERNNYQYMKVLRNLDKDVFAYKGKSKDTIYSRTCTGSAQRPPVVLTSAEKEYLDKNYPNSYTYSYQTGTYPKCKENYFICPSWWCEGNRVALSNEDLMKLKSKGYKCPPGLNPKHVDELPYYTHGDDEGKMKWPHAMSKVNPNNKLLPCCFVLKDPPADGKKLKAYEKKLKEKLEHNDCKSDENAKTKKDGETENKSTVKTKEGDNIIGNEEGGEDGDEEVNEEEVNTTISGKENAKEYIKNSKYDTRHAVGERGTLPISLAKYFKSLDCYGNTSTKTNCTIRNGVTTVKEYNQAFLSCMHYILWKSRKDDINLQKSTLIDFVRFIANTIPIEDYIKLNNGNTLKKYYDERRNPYDDSTFAKFKNWSDIRLISYIKKFYLKKVYETIRNKSIQKIDDIQDDEMKVKVLREFYVYNSFHTFLEFLQNDNIPKTHADVLSMFHPSCLWVNPRGLRFVVIVATDENTVYLSCEPYTVPDNNLTNDISLIYNTGNIYDVISHLYFKDSLHDRYNILYKSYMDDEKYAAIFDQQRSYCNINIKKVLDFIVHIEKEDDIERFVINYDYCVVGVVTKSGVFVPFSGTSNTMFNPAEISRMGMSLVNLYPTYKVMYITDVSTLKPMQVAIDKMLKHLYTVGFQGTLNEVTIGDKTNEQIFVGYNSEHLGFQSKRTELTPSEIVQAFILEVRTRPEIVRKISLLQSSLNPMTHKEVEGELNRIVTEILGSLDIGVHKDDMNAAVQLIQDTDIEYHIGKLYSEIKIHDNETYFTDGDIKHGVVDTIFNHMQNPYKHTLKTIQDNVVYRDVSKDLEQSMKLSHYRESNCEYEHIRPKARQDEHNIPITFETAVCKSHPTDLYGIFSIVANIVGVKFEREVIQKMVQRKLTSSKQIDQSWIKAVQRLRKIPFFAKHLPSTNFANVEVSHIVTLMEKGEYVPTFLELIEIAQYLNVGIIVVGEANSYGVLNTNGLLAITVDERLSNRFVLLQMSVDKDNVPRFYPIIYYRRKLVVSKEEIGKVTLMSILKKVQIQK